MRRRAVLLSLVAALGACTGFVRGLNPAPGLSTRRYAGPYRLRIAIFQADRLDLPFHAGLLIDAPEGRILYDPAGFWRSDQCSRTHDVHYPIDDATADDWLSRGGLDRFVRQWTLHLFETDVAAEVASQAYTLAFSRPPMPALSCAWSVADLLSELPGFAEIEPRIVTARLLDQLRARPDLSYSTRRL